MGLAPSIAHPFLSCDLPTHKLSELLCTIRPPYISARTVSVRCVSFTHGEKIFANHCTRMYSRTPSPNCSAARCNGFLSLSVGYTPGHGMSKSLPTGGMACQSTVTQSRRTTLCARFGSAPSFDLPLTGDSFHATFGVAKYAGVYCTSMRVLMSAMARLGNSSAPPTMQRFAIFPSVCTGCRMKSCQRTFLTSPCGEAYVCSCGGMHSRVTPYGCRSVKYGC